MTVFKYDNEVLNNLVKGLRSIPKAVESATSRSINRTLITVRKDITSRVKEDFNVKTGAFKTGLSITKATTINVEGVLKAIGSPGVPLIDYNARFRISPAKVPSTTWKKGTAFPLYGVSGVVRKTTGRTKFQGAFVARMPGGHRGVFIRVPGLGNSGRQRIKQLYGPSAARILTSGRYTTGIRDLVRTNMKKNMLNETKNIFRKLGKL